MHLLRKSASFVEPGNAFAFNFLDKVNAASLKDYVISPLSLQFLLGMLLDGAQNETEAQICRVLGYGAGEADAVDEYCRGDLHPGERHSRQGQDDEAAREVQL